MRAVAETLCLAALLVFASACSGALQGNAGDCSGFVKFNETVYQIKNEAIDRTSQATKIGEGDSLNCDKEPIEQVKIYQITGVGPEAAVAVPDPSDPESYLVWVAEDLQSSDWPKALRESDKEQTE